jgi:5-methylcytosine-specific restriction endonuclease McrA
MKRVQSKRPRLRLDLESYRRLHQKILARDRWRCQICGRSSALQVHHIDPRSRLGDDAEENLITLCADCHRVPWSSDEPWQSIGQDSRQVSQHMGQKLGS